MLTTLVRLLALSMVPVLIFGTAETSQAATTYSDAVEGTVLLDDFRPGYDNTCAVAGFYGITDDETQSVHLSMRCDFGWMLTSVETPNMTAGMVANGPSCTASVDFGSIAENVQYSAAPGVAYGCQITEVCVSMHRDMPWLPDITWYGCTPLDLGVPPTPVVETSGSCAYGQVQKPTRVPGTDGYWYSNQNNKWQRGEKFKGYVTPSAGPGDARWTLYFIREYTQGSDWGSPSAAPAVGAWTEWTPPNGVPAERELFMAEGWEGGYTNNGAPPGTWDQPKSYYEKQQSVVVGVGLQRGFYTDRFQIPVGTVGTDDGWAGVTDPARCLFYWGKPVANFTAGYTGTGTGTPISELDPAPSTGTTTPPVVDPTPPAESSACSFSFNDPSTWATAGLCALVQLFGRMLDLLGNLLEAVWGLVQAILDGLASLLIPDGAFMESKADEIKAAWADTPPMVFMDGVQEVGDALVISGPSGGCQGPPLTFNNPVNGESTTVHMLSACGDAMANLAALIKLALTVTVYVGGFLAAVRIVAASFGIDASIGRGGDEVAA